MHVTELCQRYPAVDTIVALGNESREHSPSTARICDFLAELCADLIQHLPQQIVVDAPAPAARFDPYTGQPLMTAPVGTPGLSQGWPQPAPPAVVAVAPVDDKAEIKALLAALAAKL